MHIPIEVKARCCELQKQGKTYREIYDEFREMVPGTETTLESFGRMLRKWRRKVYPDQLTLDRGTYEGFTTHDATVQVSGNGEIVQAWIKQSANGFDQEDFLSALSGKVEPYVRSSEVSDGEDMLEISLFDMHWGIAFLDYYAHVLDEVLAIITDKHWEKIVIPFGQDFFHNDSIVNGQTTKGTQVEKVDMVRAVKDGQRFIYAIIDAALEYANEVRVIYSPGNHDRSISWMFMQTLLERYGDSIVDDSLEFRKVVTYGKNAIMITHGDSKRATSRNLAHIFPIAFPGEFAGADVREVHSGHLHHEAEADVYGVMVRRLSSGNQNDEWSNREDFIGSHKRFMLFAWSLDKLKTIYYI